MGKRRKGYRIKDAPAGKPLEGRGEEGGGWEVWDERIEKKDTDEQVQPERGQIERALMRKGMDSQHAQTLRGEPTKRSQWLAGDFMDTEEDTTRLIPDRRLRSKRRERPEHGGDLDEK